MVEVKQNVKNNFKKQHYVVD